MGTALDYIILFSVAGLGWYVFKLLRLSLPSFLGALTFAGVLNYFYLYPEINLNWLSFLSKVVVGIMLGRRLDRSAISTLKKLPLPALLTALWMLFASLIAGGILYLLTDLSLATVMVGSAAGGIAEMVIFAMSLHENVVVVAFIQTFRLIFVMLSVPVILKLWFWYLKKQNKMPEPELLDQKIKFEHIQSLKHISPLMYVVMLLTAGGCGYALDYMSFPAGALVGAVVGSSFVMLLSGGCCYFSSKISSVAQMCLGVIIAKSLTHDTVLILQDLFLPLVVPTFILMVLCVILSYVLMRTTKWDPITCILATVPAGIIQIIPIAETYKADVLKVGILHMVRIFVIVIFFPFLIRMII